MDNKNRLIDTIEDLIRMSKNINPKLSTQIWENYIKEIENNDIQSLSLIDFLDAQYSYYLAKDREYAKYLYSLLNP